MLLVLMMMIEGHPADANNASLPHIERMIEPKWPPLRTVGIKNFWSQMCFEKLNSFFILGCANSKIQKTRQGSKVFGLVWKSTFVTSLEIGLRLVSLMRAISCYLTYGGQLAGKRSNNGPQYVPRVTWNGGRGVLTGGREDQPSPLWKPYLEPTVGQLRPATPAMSFSLGWFDLKSLRKILWSSSWLSSWPESDFIIFAGFGGGQVKISTEGRFFVFDFGKPAWFGWVV